MIRLHYLPSGKNKRSTQLLLTAKELLDNHSRNE